MALLGRKAAPAVLRAVRSISTTIDASRLKIINTTNFKPKVANEKLVFGAVTSDHLLECDWTASEGWAAPVISPYRQLEIDPAASCLHYGLQAFEGMKAYADDSGAVRLFRPDLNMARLAASMAKLSMPALDRAGFLQCIQQLVKQEVSWVPTGTGFSLYLRPTVIATWPYLGVNEAKSIKLYTIACPVGPYYPEGFKPVKLFADIEHVRAWPGGVGDAKVGGNYAPTIRVQAAAAKKGFSQVLWLFGPQHEVTEAGTMNFFCFWKNEAGERELITPPLDGTILPGVTRQSIVDLARSWGEFKVSERKFTMQQLTEAARAGRVLECFGAGTAAVVSPIKAIHYAGVDYDIPIDAAAGAGPLTRRVWDELTAIQYGRKAGPEGWSVVIPGVKR